MSIYDQQCARAFADLQPQLEKYFIEVDVDCPYELPQTATFFQGMFGPVPDHVMELFLAAGYRRNGPFLYAMRCKTCHGCVPIRLLTTEFLPSRSQKRVMRKNRDVKKSIKPVEASEENIALCDKFLADRYPSHSNSGAAYYSGFFQNSIVSTVEVRFRVEERLLGNGIIDVGGNWMNAVYFYFDPDEKKRSLGTFNILSMVDLCRQMEIDYLYLGYHIDQIPAMNYKRKFKPHHLYLDSKWHRFDGDYDKKTVVTDD